MTFVTVHCPHCDSEQIVKRGKTRRGTQRYLCQNTACITGSFLLHYRNRGCLPEVKQPIIDMSLNASGVRDTARSLHISPTTVLSALKKGSGQIRVHAAHGMNMNLPATLFRPHRGVWIVDCTSRQAYKVCVVMAPRERWS